MREEGELRETKERAVTVMAFSVMFFSEFGDKTQIAAMVLTARFGEPLWVFLGVMGALMGLSILAVFGGKGLARLIPTTLLHRVAGIMFIIVGIVTWASCFR